jgi:hypothetical protein
MKIVAVAVFIVSLFAISYAADPIKTIPPQKKVFATDSIIYTCPKQTTVRIVKTSEYNQDSIIYPCPKKTTVRIVKTSEYNQDGWQGGTMAGPVTVDVIAHSITPDRRMYCDYAAPGSMGISRAFPSRTTCTPIANFSFACIATTNEYNQDGWQGGTMAGPVTVDVIAHSITPDKRMYCDYAAPGSMGISRAFPTGTTCTPIDTPGNVANFSFACTPTK